MTRLLALLLFATADGGNLVVDIRTWLAANNLPAAEAELRQYRAARGETPEYLEAQSWLARFALSANRYDQARQQADATITMVRNYLRQHKLDADPHVPQALGAAVEVTAQAMVMQGQRADAVIYLQKQLAAYRGTSVQARIQKNLNLLTLEGKPAPALDERVHLGPAPVPLAQLRGKPVLLFFWAHWCSDCKQEIPILSQIMATYGPKGLTLIGPTQHYGYAAQGEDTTPADELRYIEAVRQRFYAPLSFMLVPVSEENFQRYGASTTPTLVLIDRQGIVRVYHPGNMTYAELSSAISSLLRS